MFRESILKIGTEARIKWSRMVVDPMRAVAAINEEIDHIIKIVTVLHVRVQVPQ